MCARLPPLFEVSLAQAKLLEHLVIGSFVYFILQVAHGCHSCSTRSKEVRGCPCRDELPSGLPRRALCPGLGCAAQTRCLSQYQCRTKMSYWQPKSAMSLPQAAHKRGEYRQLIGIQWVEGNLAVAPAGFAEARPVPIEMG